MDLNIDNYSLADILGLFRIPHNFTKTDVVNAKKIVLKTHPDKSRLPADYFRFYAKAYRVVLSMWEFKNKSELSRPDDLGDYSDISEYTDESKRRTLDDFLENKSQEDFGKWFNDAFDKNNIARADETTGYGDWFSSDSDVSNAPTISYSQMGEEIEKKRRDMTSTMLTRHRDFGDVVNYGDGNSLDSSAPDSYCSDMFSRLPFEDLKKAHTETLIPVTSEDFLSVKQFKSVGECKMFRDSQQNIDPMTTAQSNDYFARKSAVEDEHSTFRAYQLAKELSETTSNQKQFWGNLMKISNT